MVPIQIVIIIYQIHLTNIKINSFINLNFAYLSTVFIEVKDKYDIVVIGAGISGLTSAAILSKAGYSVCVLEMADHPGGYLASFTRKDFKFESSIHWLNQCNENGIVGKIFDLIGSDHPIVKSKKYIKRYKGNNHDYLLTNKPVEMMNNLISNYPEEKSGIKKIFKVAEKIGKSFDDNKNDFLSKESMTFSQRMINYLRIFRFIIPIIPYVKYTGEEGVKKGLNKFSKKDFLHDIFCAEHELLGCLIPISWAYYGDFQNPPKGGSQNYTDWLTHVITQLGNKVQCRSKVEKIILEGKFAKGVQYTNNRETHIINSDYIIAACDVQNLYDKMLPSDTISDKFRDKLNTAKLYSSAFTVYIALDCKGEELGFGEELIYLTRTDIPLKDHTGSDPDKSLISVLSPSVADPTMAPEGKGTLVIYTPALFSQLEFWNTTKDKDGNIIRGDEYKKLKEEFANTLIDRIEREVSPGLRKHILFYSAATPISYWRYTGNRDGSIMGAKPGKENYMAKIEHYQTPVTNVILGGQWATLGGGVVIAVKAATNAAMYILKKKNKKVFKLILGYMRNNLSKEDIHNSLLLKTYNNSWKNIGR